jgi:hypothetical protein
MWAFYWRLTRRVPAILWTAANISKSVIAFAAFLLLLLNRYIGGKLLTWWHGISPWWAFLPVGLIFLYGLMKANYERYCQLEKLGRTDSQDRHYQEVKTIFEGCNDDEKATLRHLWRVEEMTQSDQHALGPIPDELSRGSTDLAAVHLVEKKLVSRKYKQECGHWQVVLTIAEWAKPHLEELV